MQPTQKSASDDDLRIVYWYLGKKLSPALKQFALGHNLTIDDLAHEAIVYFLRFPPKPGVARTTALCKSTFWTVVRIVRSQKSHQYLGFPLTDATIYQLGFPNAGLKTIEQQEMVEKLLRFATPHQQSILRRYYGIGQPPCTAVQIAEQLQTSTQAVRESIRRGLRAIRGCVKVTSEATGLPL